MNIDMKRLDWPPPWYSKFANTSGITRYVIQVIHASGLNQYLFVVHSINDFVIH